MQLLYGLKLKTRKLDNIDRFFPRRLHQRSRRRADFSAHLRMESSRFEKLSGQRRGSSLAVRSGDADQAASEKPRGQFRFSDNVDAFLSRCFQFLQVGRHTGRNHDEILIDKRFRQMSSRLKQNAERPRLAKLFQGPPVRNRDNRTASMKESRRGHTALGSTDYEYALAVEIHAPYLNF